MQWQGELSAVTDDAGELESLLLDGQLLAALVASLPHHETRDEWGVVRSYGRVRVLIEPVEE